MFLDESGNLDFSVSGTEYFVLTCVGMTRPFLIASQLDSYKYDCVEWGLEPERFHCVEDNRHVRGRVFNIIAGHLNELRVDCLVVEKRKTAPALRDDRRFYPDMLGYLLRDVIAKFSGQGVDEVIIITDTIPLQRRRQAIQRAVKVALARELPRRPTYRILHHDSRSHYGLQVADYCSWAIFRKYERGELEYFRGIEPAISGETEIFRSESRLYY